MRRWAASVGAVALTAGGMLAMAPAFADTPANIDKDATGSIIVHKHVKDATSTDGNPAGAPLDEVKFMVQEVLFEGDPIDLSTAAGWDLAEQIWAGTPPALPDTDYSLTTGVTDETNSSGIATFNVSHIGVYLVTEIGSTKHIITDKAAPFWVTVPYPDGAGGWDYSVDVYPKNVLGTPGEPTKTAGDDAKVLGQNVTWTITMPVAASALPYSSFTITDDVSTNPYLDFVSWGDVTVGTTTLVPGDSVDDNDYTISGDDSTITFTADGLAVLDTAGDTTVTVTFVTKVKAIPADGTIINNATVTVNGQEKPTDGKMNWGELRLHKHSAANEAALAGAEFELYDSDPRASGFTGSPIATGTTDASGDFLWTVWLGDETVSTKAFWVKETKAPAGHVLPADPVWEVTVSAGTLAESAYSIDIANHKPTVPELPLTGSTGSLMFLLIGLGLIGSGATIAGVRKARMNS